MKQIVCALISLYQLAVSPVLGNRCRFHPTCSQYAKDAIALHGLGRGTWLSTVRLARCHPWHRGGFDPVPDKR